MVLKIPCYPKRSKEDLTAAANAVFTARKISRKTASNLLADRMQITRNQAGTYIKCLVDGLAGNMRFAAASLAGRAIECCARKGRF
jgi:hypothetical protein